MANFKAFASTLNVRMNQMMKAELLYVVDIPGDTLWDTYLASFPEGTDPIFKERTTHDCQCCRQFIKNIAGVVSIKNGKVISIWDGKGLEYPYDVVAANLSELVHSAKIRTRFLKKELQFGQETTRSYGDSGNVISWNHFYVTLDRKFTHFSPAARLGQFDSTFGVFRRGMEEISLGTIDTVLNLIKDNNLYRGAEFRTRLDAFRTLKKNYNKAILKDVFLLENMGNTAKDTRNTVIGTLLVDIEKGVSLEAAVGSFENKMAGGNYKRPKALVTQKMVEEAVQTLSDLGLESALNRRYARIEDVSVNNVLFVDNAVAGKMKDGKQSLIDLLAPATKTKTPDFTKAQKVTIDEFMSKVMPKASSMSVVLGNHQLSNFVSLTAPVDEDSGSLFKWGNDFSWSYDGNVADSMKERVKAAGGQVEGVQLRVSLGWFNTDDLDLHCKILSKRSKGATLEHFYFGHKGGILDVDIIRPQVGSKPVENMRWVRLSKDGIYEFAVNNYNRRGTGDEGFDLQLEYEGGLYEYSYRERMGQNQTVRALAVTVSGGAVQKVEVISKALTSQSTPREKWGVRTNEAIKVQTIMNSPNHWDGEQEGNKHWFFILDGCRNDEPTRGIYNEYLRGDLERHRKVFEILGDKTQCQPDEADGQLSGVGFSSTKNETLHMIVDNRPYAISF